MFWLTSIKGEQNLEPQDLSKILYIVSSFLRESSDSVVLLEGIEYLTYSNTFDAVLRFIYALDDCITLNDSRLILPVNPKTFSVKEMGLLKKEMTIL
jgi:archaellum biogenesis ATPase FlaH